MYCYKKLVLFKNIGNMSQVVSERVSSVPPPKTVGVVTTESVRVIDAQPISTKEQQTIAEPSLFPSSVRLLSVAAPARFAMWLIRQYQTFLSFDHSPIWSMFFPYGFCRFTPTCSQYTHDAIEKRGIVMGILLGCWRILRCNPFSHGGIDHVPDRGFKRQRTDS